MAGDVNGSNEDDSRLHAAAQPEAVGSISADGAGNEGDSIGSDMPMPQVIKQLHSGQRDAETLPTDVRQRCVGHLTLEGFTTIEIAQLMRISERTVRRDRAAVRQDDALAPDAHLGDELLGEFQKMCMGAVQRLVRLAQETQNPAYARLWAEEAIVRIYQRLIDTVHRLHYFEDGKGRLEDADAGFAKGPEFEKKVLAALAELGKE